MKRDRDSQDQAIGFWLLIWAVLGGVLGLVLGFVLAVTRGWPLLPTVLAFAIGCAVLVRFGIARAASVASDAAVRLIVPSGSSTPARVEYSHAASLVARGRYPEAVAVYERAAEEDAAATEPCLQLGRLFRDRLDDPESAVMWFRRARDRTSESGLAHLVTRELVGVLAGRLDAPARALPDLARLAETHADTSGGTWAREEIRRLKTILSSIEE